MKIDNISENEDKQLNNYGESITRRWNYVKDQFNDLVLSIKERFKKQD